MLTNKVNGKQYIGQTIQEDVNRRWNVYKTLNNSAIGKVLFSALAKYTPTNFKFEIICICFNSDCNHYEVEYIKKYNTMVPNGYNLQEGGKNPIIPNRTRILSPEERVRLSENRRVKNITLFFGKKLSDEHKARLSKALKGRKHVTTTPKNPCMQRTIEKYDKDHKLIETFDTLTAAAKTIDTSYTIILKYANTGKLYREFYWKIAEEKLFNGEQPIGLAIGREANKKKLVNTIQITS